MNLESINSVNQLIEANAQPAPVEHNADTMYQLCLEHLGMEDATKLAIMLVEQLAIFHQNTRHELTEAGDAERACLWTHDEALLACALNALKNVTLD
jgi:hypothetical protein